MKTFYLFLIIISFASVTKAQNATLEFVKNNGQWDGDFIYKSVTGTGDIFLQKNAITYVIGEPGAVEKMDAFKHGQIKIPPVLKYHAYKMLFENSHVPVLTEQKVQTHYYNYFLGNDASRWKSNIHPALAINYERLYDGIDMHLSSEKGNLKYDFIIQPDADVSQIKLKIEGADKVSLKNGNLVIGTSVGDVQELKPVVYQYVNDQRVAVACNYVLNNNTVGFQFPNDYNHSVALIIDPTVVFCTFTGSTADNWGFTATYDSLGNFYAGGLVNGLGFPANVGAFQTTFGGGTTTAGSAYPCDMAIIKFDATGASKIYGTYIGGRDNDQPHSMIVDNNGDLIIAGRTYSDNFPVTASAYDGTYNGGADIVVVKLNNTGTALLGSTYIGGSGDDCVNTNASEYVFGGIDLKHNYGDDARSEVLIDKSGNIYVASSTKSTNFPTVNPIQSSLSGTQDAVLIKLNSTLSSLVFSTYLGGSSVDAGYVLGLNTTQTSIYIAGGTMSSDFPSTPGTLHASSLGGTDGYILKISNGPTYTLQRGSFIGTGNYDQVYGLQVDVNDYVYLMGQTLGGTFPVSSGVYSNPNSSQFVIKLDNTLTTSVYSTVFGSGNSAQTNISPAAFLVDTCENVYISGWGGSLGLLGASPSYVGTTTGMPITAGTAIQSTTDGADFYFIVLSKNATSLLYGSYFGRTSTDMGKGEHVDGGTSRFDKNGIVYQAICGGCYGSGGTVSAFPTTAGSYSPKNGSSNCNLAALKISFDLSAVKAITDVSPNAKGCPPFTVSFTNKSVNAKTYDWYFADGTPNSAAKEPTHTFYKPGTYIVRMVAYNPDACIEYDTSYLTITVDSNSIKSNFTYLILDSCNTPYKVSFTNTSRYGKNPSPKFYWDFGDGTTFTGTTPPTHAYSSTGTFFVQLVMVDDSACNSPDTIRQPILIQSKFLKASVSLPDVLCAKAGGLYFANLSTNAISVWWDFGDGSTSTEVSPTHVYDTGTYHIVLVVFNSGACNTTDTFRKTISIKAGATANFTYAPTIPNPNDSTKFTNLSVGALSYLWDFGDGTKSYADSPTHMYRKTGLYKACLIAYGYEGCNDTLCKMVPANIVPRIDVPTGFTPNGDGINDVLYVKGAAIESLNFRIYNRWGQLVFQTNSAEVGWDGKFHGQLQPMESYAYVLSATFIDGTTEEKKGNITLLP